MQYAGGTTLYVAYVWNVSSKLNWGDLILHNYWELDIHLFFLAQLIKWTVPENRNGGLTPSSYWEWTLDGFVFWALSGRKLNHRYSKLTPGDACLPWYYVQKGGYHQIFIMTRKLFTVKIAVATKRVSIIFLRLFNPERGITKQLIDNSFYSFPIMYVLYPSKEHFAMILIQCNI